MSLDTNPTERIFYMDNIRALAMLLGVFFHAAIPYGPLLHEIWLLSDQQHSWLMDFGAWGSHVFRMPLFFVVAGFFAHLLLRKRGIGGFLRHRAKRILLPFLIFLPLLTGAMLFVIVHAVDVVQAKSPMQQLIAANMNNPEAEQPPFSTMHLWFLYHLFCFCLLTGLVARFKGQALQKLADRLFSSPVHLLYLPLLLIPSLFVNPVPLPAPERIWPELWSFGYFGLFYLFGWQLFQRRDYLQRIAPYWQAMLGVGLALWVGIYLLLPEITLASVLVPPQGYDFSARHVAAVLMEAYAAVFLTLALLVLGQRFLDKSHAALRYIADASYWIYLIHLPILLLIQTYLQDVGMSIWFKFLISSGATLGIGLLTYALLVRYTPLGTLLNGQRRRLPSLQTSVPPVDPAV